MIYKENLVFPEGVFLKKQEDENKENRQTILRIS